MAFANLIDNSSTTVSANTPGVTVQLTYHTTLRLASVGVPVRMKVLANSTTADTGSVKLLDSNGAAVLTVLVNQSGENWYQVNGYIPATEAKYDLHYGGNTTGTLTVYAASCYELDWTSLPVSGSLSSSIGNFTLSSAGIVETKGELSQSIGDFTLSAAGTVVSVPPAYQATGTAQSGTTNLTVAWPTHATNDVAILYVLTSGGSDPGSLGLSTANGFASITSLAANDGTHFIRHDIYWCRASSGSMSSPVTNNGSIGAVANIITFRGCTTSGNPYEVTSSGSQTATTAVSVSGATTTLAAQHILMLVAEAEAGTTSSAWTNANLTSFTERDDSAGTKMAIHAASGTYTGPGAYGSSTMTLAATSDVISSFTISLKP